MPDPVTLLASAEVASGVVKATEESVSIISRLVGALRAQPDLAATQLSAVLDEVLKTYQAVDGAIARFGSLAVGDALASRSEDLLSMAGGSLESEVENRRGHSSDIRNIYDKYLFRWFEKVFNSAEMEAMTEAFHGPNGLANADLGLFTRLTEVVGALRREAYEIAPLVLAEDFDGAKRRIVESYLTLAPLQQEMADAMVGMARLKNDFIDIARVA